MEYANKWCVFTTKFALRSQRVSVTVTSLANVFSSQFDSDRYMRQITLVTACLQFSTGSDQSTIVMGNKLHAITNTFTQYSRDS